jgi:hypothetical protein
MKNQTEGYSANVRMSIKLDDGTEIPVQQMGGDFILITPIKETKPPCEANLTLVVDASKTIFHVYLPEGITAEHAFVKLANVRTGE